MGRITVYLTVAVCIGIVAINFGVSLTLYQYLDAQANAIQGISQNLSEAINNDRKLRDAIYQWVERDVAILDAIFPGYHSRFNESRGNDNGSSNTEEDARSCQPCHQ